MTKRNSPKVSVYIPTRNRAEMLKRAIQSVLKQTYTNIEIIVSDDGSTDETSSVMKNYCHKHKNIKYLNSETSKGACHARNKAILAATGEFVTGLDDDDEFFPSRIETFVKAYKEGDFFLCGLIYVYNGKRLIPSHYYQRRIQKNNIFRRNCISNQIFVKRDDLIKNDIFFDEAFPAWQDYDFFTNLVCNLGPGRRIYKRTYILHTDHDKDRITNSMRILQGYCLYHKKYARLMTPSQRASLAVNAYVLQKRQVPKKLKALCFRYSNYYDLFKIIKSDLKLRSMPKKTRNLR